MKPYIIKCFAYSLHLIILFYGCIKLLSDYFWCFIPTGTVLVFCVVAAVYYFRIPPPSPQVIEEILGQDMPDVNSDDTENIIKVVAHRGALLDAPENTLAAYSYCKKKGCDFIEFDICLTADGVPIVFHDFSTGRLCHDDLEIEKTNWADLKKLNLSEKHPRNQILQNPAEDVALNVEVILTYSNYSKRIETRHFDCEPADEPAVDKKRDLFPETRIPTLEEAVTHLLGEEQKMFIDIKYRDSKLVKVVLDIFKKHPELYTQALVTSFFPSVIYQIRRKDPRIVGAVAWCPHSIYFASRLASQGGPLWKKQILHIFDEILAWLLPRFIYFLAGFSVILLHRYSMDVKTVWDWRRRGLRVMGWTINKPFEKKYCLEMLQMPYLTDTLDEDNNIIPPTKLEQHMEIHYTEK